MKKKEKGRKKKGAIFYETPCNAYLILHSWHDACCCRLSTSQYDPNYLPTH